MHRVFIIVFFFSVALSPAFAGQTDSTFAIDSYVPDMFRDFEWKLGGNFGYGGLDDDRETAAYYLGVLRRGNSSASSTTGNLGVSSLLIYRMDAPRYILTASVPLSLSGALRSGNYDEYWPTSDVDEETSKQSSDSRSVAIGTRPSIQTDLYLTDIFFARLRVRSYLDYSESPQNETHIDRRQSDQLHGYLVLTRELGYSSVRYTSRLYSASASAGIGVGRIWEGQYASTSLYIIEELRRNNALLREPTFEEMSALADTIRYFRLVHAVDSRLLRLEALSTILSMLQSSGVVGDVGPYGVYMIQDVWDYFPRVSRGFGAASNVGVGGDFTHSHDDYSHTSSRLREITYDHPDTAGYQSVDTLAYDEWQNNSFYREMARLYYYLDAAWSRPLTSRLQLNLVSEARMIVHNRSEEDTYRRTYESDDSAFIREDHLIRDNREVYWEVDVSTQLQYLLDSRTELVAGLDYTFVERYTSSPYPDRPYWMYVESSVDNRHTVGASLTALYRLSIPTTLKGSAVFLYDDYCRTTTKYSHTQWGLNLSIEHYLY